MISDKKGKLIAKRDVINFSLSLVLTAVFLYIAFHNVDFKKVLETSSRASLFWIVVYIVVLVSSHYLRAVRWKVIIDSVQPHAKMRNLFGALMVGYGVNCVIPRFGEITRAVLLGRWEKISRSSMFGTVILERVIDVIFLGLSVIAAALIYSGNLYLSFPWLKTTLFITSALIAAFIIFLLLIVKFKEKFYGVIIVYLGKISETVAHKAGYVFRMLTEGFSSLKGVQNYFLTILLSVVIMLLYALNAYVGMIMIGLPNINFATAWVVMSISAIGVVIPTPGGTGSYHALAKSALVLLYGYGEVISLAYAFLTHIISYFLFIISALIIFFVLNRYHDNLIKVVETEMEEL
ncbi:MAG TPA: lysylphosphatidylglycerol synthase transmembrane domain-containing protein [Ignavibacteriaceae bacterium]|nr:lysylphosphatidylglycerol synthase transmembrane domain-containing protein [Ignavibacteriaceae bacterium]